MIRAFLACSLIALTTTAALGEAQSLSGLLIGPRTHPPYELWMLQMMNSLRERDPPGILVGDSLVSGWPEDLQRKVSPAGTVNFGAGGDTTANLLWRIRHALKPGMQMTSALVLVGTNDLPVRSAEEIAKVIGTIVSDVQSSAPRVCVTLIGLLPRRDGRLDFDGKIQDVNHRLAGLEAPRVRFVDSYKRLQASCPPIEPCELYQDSVHLTRSGYELLTNIVHETTSQHPCYN